MNDKNTQFPLAAPGGIYETTVELVRGVNMPVFKQRPRSTREVLLGAAKFGDRDYLVRGDQRITYAQVTPLVASAAKALRDQYGISKGDRVAILAANYPEWIIAFWAVTSLGGVVIALNAWWVKDEIEYALAHSAPKLLITDPRRREITDTIDHGIQSIDIQTDFSILTQSDPSAELPTVHIDEDDPAVMLYTSGTTGRPKGALLPHRAIIGFMQVQAYRGIEGYWQATGELPQPGPNQPALIMTTPMFHIAAIGSGIMSAASSGTKVVFREGRFDPAKHMALVEKEQITMLTMMGSMAPRILALPNLADYDLSSITTVGTGGGPTSPSVLEGMRKAFPSSPPGMGYGSSETAALGAGIGGQELIDRPTSTGRKNVHHELEIRDEQGNVLPPNEQGEIYIHSAYLMLEYWLNPEATAKTLLPGHWCATGDIGHLDEEGFLYVNSRARDMIIRSGENVYPIEIEHRLDAHPEVAESAVIGVEHAELGQEVKAVVVLREGQSLTEDELTAWASEALAVFKVPTLWDISYTPLPRNPTGKVLKNELESDGETTARFVEEE